MTKFLLAGLIALATGAGAQDVVLDDGRRLAVDPELVVVSHPDLRAAVFIVYSADGSKTVESVGVSGCLSERGIVAHGHPGAPPVCVAWGADADRSFDLVARLMCAQKASGAKYLELLRHGQQLLPVPPSARAKFKLM